VNLTVYLPLLIAPLFALVAPKLSRRLPPAPATWLLSAGAFVVAASTAVSLMLLASPLVAQLPGLSAAGGWSDAVLALHDPVRTPVAIAALVAFGCLITSAIVNVVRQSRSVVAAGKLTAALPAQGDLALLDTDAVDAFAVPGRPGRIVVSRALLRLLDGRERRAVLAHERAHLRDRHHLHIGVTALAAAANPMLRSLRPEVRRSCERWADESAAAITGRDVVAAALLRAESHGGTPLPAPVMAMNAVDVEARVAALRVPAPRLERWRLMVPVGLVLACVGALGNAMIELHTVFELAQHR
jgi:Zn-dependent protease with chaperone function